MPELGKYGSVRGRSVMDVSTAIASRTWSPRYSSTSNTGMLDSLAGLGC